MESESRARRTFAIAIILILGVAVGVPLWLGVPQISWVGAAVAAMMLAIVRLDSDTTRAARSGIHVALGAAVGLVTFAVYGVGISPVISVYFSTLVVLGASHVLGARAAAAWSIPCLALIVATVWSPPTVVYDADEVSTVVTRVATLLTVLAFSVSFRVHQDRQADELERLAMTDALTGLANRRQMERALDDAIQRAQRYERQCAVVFIDVDGLKPVNDIHGHEAGDALISGVAKRIDEGTRRIDTVARIGGDEFVVVLSEVSGPAGVEAFARALLERVCTPLDLGATPMRPSVSVGTASYPSTSDDAKNLLRFADAAMYAAKQAGGGCLFAHDGSTAQDCG